jgi:hypothetical protein
MPDIVMRKNIVRRRNIVMRGNAGARRLVSGYVVKDASGRRGAGRTHGGPKAVRSSKSGKTRSATTATARFQSEIAQTRALLKRARADARRKSRECDELKALIEIAFRGARIHAFAQDRNLRYTWVAGPRGVGAASGMLGRTDDELWSSPERRAVVAVRRRVIETGTAEDCEASCADPLYMSVGKPLPGCDPAAMHGKTDAELPRSRASAIVALKTEVLQKGEPRDAELRIDTDTGTRWYDLRIEPMRDVSGGLVGLTGAAIDVTERKQGEAYLCLLMRELTHRSKNLLAVIQAMARQTARHSGSIATFLDRFGARARSPGAGKLAWSLSEGTRPLAAFATSRPRTRPGVDRGSGHPPQAGSGAKPRARAA